MGHGIYGLIGAKEMIAKISESLTLDCAGRDLPQGLYLLYMSDSLLDEIGERMAMRFEAIPPFYNLSKAVAAYLEGFAGCGPIVYIETDYFGGSGTQYAAFFCDGVLQARYTEQCIREQEGYPGRWYSMPINRALRQLGVVCDPGKDGFDSLGLGRCRHMPG